MFQKGQKVVCISSKGFKVIKCPDYPIEGSIYTIAYVNDTSFPGHVFVALHEFPPEKGLEAYWYACRFRPLQERKKETDISIFKEILNKINNSEKQKA